MGLVLEFLEWVLRSIYREYARKVAIQAASLEVMVKKSEWANWNILHGSFFSHLLHQGLFLAHTLFAYLFIYFARVLYEVLPGMRLSALSPRQFYDVPQCQKRQQEEERAVRFARGLCVNWSGAF